MVRAERKRIRAKRHDGPKFDGAIFQYTFSPFRRGVRQDGDKTLETLEWWTKGETAASVFEHDRAERRCLSALLPTRPQSCKALWHELANASWLYAIDLERFLRPAAAASRDRHLVFAERLHAVRACVGELFGPTEIADLVLQAGLEPLDQYPWQHLEPKHFSSDGTSRLNLSFKLLADL